jgi:hypothetical protein
MSAAADNDPKAIVLADFSGADTEEWKASAAEGVTCALSDTRDGAGKTARMLVATNTGKVPRRAAWARVSRRFDPPLNLEEQPALGVWIEGDGLGEIIAFRLESPRHLAFGAVADRYLNVDFTGRRFFTLVETESSRWSDYVWNDGKGLYNVYRETIDFGAVESVVVGYQHLASGREARCRIGPVKALPMLAGLVKDPAVTLNGMTVVFPVAMGSGSWIECKGPGDCALYGPKGEFLERVTPRGAPPILRTGDNSMQFSCGSTPGPSPRAKLTVFCRGEEL